jgi:GDP-L-fucose synthase
MNKDNRILITGGTGLVGSSIVRALIKKKYKNIYFPNKKEMNLLDKKNVLKILKKIQPDYIFAPAAFVGGIEANMNDPINFLSRNILMQNNLILTADELNVKNLLFFGSSCIYPKFASQPIKEKELLRGELEKTNEAYAIAKISGLKLCAYLREFKKRNYFTIMPTNLYGENDNFNDSFSHVVPAIIKKVAFAKKNNRKEINLLGTGKAKREFLYIDDLAKAAIVAMKKNKKYSMINVGSGTEISILNLAKTILKIANYKANIKFISNTPDGTPRKLLNSNIMKSLGWKPCIKLVDGLKKTYKLFEIRNNVRL